MPDSATACLKTQQYGYKQGKELHSSALYPPATKPPQESTAMTYPWRKAPSGVSGQPLPAHYLDHPDGWGYAVFPEVGGRGWESAYRGTDEGFSYLEYFATLAEAKRSCERSYDREARLLAEKRHDAQ